MLIFSLHVQTNRKLAVVNKITRNLFLQRPQGIDHQIAKEKILTLIKQYRNKRNGATNVLVQTEITFLPTHYI